MSYQIALERLYQLALFHKIKLGLETAREISAHLDHPQQSYPMIHIAGTNGKGSVATMISEALSLSGYRVGLYTSPHLSSLRERIQVNNTLISEEEVAQGITPILDTFTLTFFEAMTFLAFEHFKKKHVDVAVIETGLGGRLDTTNIIQPQLSIITSIAKDHTYILGDTLDAIAFEKAGIIKKHIPVVIGPSARRLPIFQAAQEKRAPILFSPEHETVAKTALKFLCRIFPHLNDSHIQKGIQKKPPARFELLPGKNRVIMDVAHNPAALNELFRKIKSRPSVLIGLSKDKDVKACLRIVAENSCHLYLAAAKNPRSAKVKELIQALDSKTPFTPLTLDHASLKKCLNESKELVICGSFYLVGEIRRLLNIEEPTDPIIVDESISLF